MATKDIILSIGGDLSGLKRELNKSAKEVRKYTNEAAKDFAVGAAATAAASAGMAVAVAVKSAEAGKELTNLAFVSNTTAKTFQGLAHGSRQYGIEADKLGDILKDMNDRVGDFNATGGGPMADFFENIAPKVGITADEFKNLSGPEALQAYYNALEKANLSQEDMTFYMEAMASDATALIPLLRENGKGFAEAAEHAEKLGLVMSDLQVEQLNQMGNSIQNIQGLFSSLTNQMGAEMAPYITALVAEFENAAIEAGGFGQITKNVMTGIIKATGFVLDAIHGIKVLFNSVADGLIMGMTKITSTWADRIQWLMEVANKVPFTNFDGAIANIQAFADEQRSVMDMARQNIEDNFNEPLPSVMLDELAAKAKIAGDAVAEAALKSREAFSEQGAQGGNVVDFDTARIDKLREQYALEQELLLEKLEAEREILNEARANGAISDEEWNQLQLAAKQSYEDGLTDIEKTASDERMRIAEQEAANRKAVMDGMFSNLSSLMNSGSKKMFEVGKKASLAQATVSGIEAAVSSYAAGAKVGGPILGAAYAATSVASTAAKISAIKGQSFGGGGSQGAQASAARSSGAGAQTIPQQQQQTTNMFVRGINPNQMFSGQQLVDIINTAQDQGAVLRVGT